MCTCGCPLVWILILLILILFVGLCIWSNILRDTIDPVIFKANLAGTKYAGKDINKVPRCFSLSRVQLGAWTIIISSCYLILALCSDCDLAGVFKDKTALLLMGISVGTTAVGSVIDKNQDPLTRSQNEPSSGFLSDILSDENGISIHRFQNVIWTIVAMTVYIYQFNSASCHLPILDDTLISLTGISSATYLGLKINENKPVEPKG